MALLGHHLRISWPAGLLTRWPWDTVTVRGGSADRADSGHALATRVLAALASRQSW